jgi:predicted phage terminase large subunit-like protein
VKLGDYRALLRSDLGLFAREVFAHLHPGGEYSHNWHIDYVASKLMAALRGDIKRLIVCMPPRSMKSILGSVALPAWALGRNPSLNIIAVSYAQDLSEKLSSDCRSVMLGAWYQGLFPNTRLSPARSAVNEFTTSHHGMRMATSTAGVLTGRGADLIIIDDPLKVEDALSDVSRRRVNDWYGNTLVSRLNNKQTGVIILIMQRLHEDDLAGYLMGKESWEVVSLPAIAEEQEHLTIESVLGNDQHVRSVGEALDSTREPLATLDAIHRSMGDYHFSSQYQQRPAPMGGGLVKAEWFRLEDPMQWPVKFSSIVQSWDTANTPHELSDYSVCTTWGIQDDHYYGLHVLRQRMDYPTLKRKVIEQAQRFCPETILIEDKSSGISLIQELGATVNGLRRYKPEGNKMFRMSSQTAKIQNGFVHLPKAASWLADYLHEMVTFPNGKFDDQIDSTSQALDWISSEGQLPNIIRFYLNEVERQKT